MNELEKIRAFISFPGREEEAHVLLLSLIAKQHCCLIGPPGTGKSLQIHTLARCFDVPYFEYLLTKFTLPEEIFGVPNVRLLREQGVLRYNTKNKLPTAILAFLDEIFKASSAILNALLAILNERIFYNGDIVQKTPLWTCLSASNETPTHSELRAFYDRFLFRQFVTYISRDLWETYLNTYWTIHQPGYQRNIPKFAWATIIAAHKKLWTVNVFNIKEPLLKIFARCEDEGVVVSDRRKGRCLVALAANAVLHGRDIAVAEDLLVLRYVIPETQKQVPIVQQIIIDVAGPQIKARQQLAELKTQLLAIIDKIKSASSLADAIKEAEAAKRIFARFEELRPSLEESLIQEFEELRHQYTETLTQKAVS